MLMNMPMITMNCPRRRLKKFEEKIGKLLWISLMTRPDLSFSVNVLSSEVARGTIATMKDVNKIECEEKLLRNSIAAMKELVESKMVEDVSWVPTIEQLADCMTKYVTNSDWLLRVANTNKLI